MISFVVLHYKNITDTLECLESIKKLDKQEEISIVVIDNNSLIKEEIEKINKYTKDLILLDNNIGFAKANNIACKYAIDNYNPDFIYCINNDTIINQNNLIELIKSTYSKYKFDLLGPKIITNDGNSVNPFPAYDTLEQIKKVINKNNVLIKIYNSVLLTFFLESYLNIKYIFKKRPTLKNGTVLQKNVSLHGCAIVFSKKYLKKYETPFYNETFLYHEEEFLTYRKNKDKLIFIYNPEIEIIHKEGASLNINFKNNRKKKIFKYKEINKSLNKLLEIYQGDL